MSEAHLARYCAEFDFRYNTRKIFRRGAHCRGHKRCARDTPHVSATSFELCLSFTSHP